MSISALFSKLGAPLDNIRWSWGGVRLRDRTVVLRVWQDNDRKVDDKWYVRILNGTASDQDGLGYQERVRHIGLLREGYSCLLIMCAAKDSTKMPREIKSFNDKDVFIGGGLCEIEGDVFIERLSRVPVVQASVA